MKILFYLFGLIACDSARVKILIVTNFTKNGKIYPTKLPFMIRIRRIRIRVRVIRQKRAVPCLAVDRTKSVLFLMLPKFVKVT